MVCPGRRGGTRAYVTDRTTKAHEYVFHLAKSGTSLFWTHRDGAGSRLQPKADYRYTDAATGVEHTEEPPDWSDELMDCPDCSGAGEFEVTEGQVSLFDGLPALTRPCSNCKDEETPGQVQRWTRANLWRGHDYFYDAFAIREPIAPASVARLSQDSFWTQHGGPKDYGTSGVYPNRSGRKALENLARKSWHGDFAPRAGDRRDSGGKGSKRNEADQQMMGANKRDVWTIPTQPYKKAHFATFPLKLAEIPLLAGTSEHGVCSECGAPWARVEDKRLVPTIKAAKTFVIDGRDYGADTNDQGANRQKDGHKSGYVNEVTTLGWRPTCAGDAPTEPALVLDHFAGSGTVGVVALQNDRSFIGIELNPEYAEMARERIAQYTLEKEEAGEGTEDIAGGEHPSEAAGGQGPTLADNREVGVAQEAR